MWGISVMKGDYTMKKDYFAIENGKIRWVASESKMELVRMFGYGNVFDSRTEAEVTLEERNKPKVHHLTDDERKRLEAEQIAYGRSKMTEKELAEAKEQRKSIDQIQLEFGRMMMAMERGVLV